MMGKTRECSIAFGLTTDEEDVIPAKGEIDVLAPLQMHVGNPESRLRGNHGSVSSNFAGEEGMTLIEVLVASIIGVVVVSMTIVGIRYLNWAARQQSGMQTQQKAQNILYNIGREIRNAPNVVSVSKDQLVLAVLDFKKWGYHSPELFKSANQGTITYAYQDVGGRTALVRTTTFPTDPSRNNTKEFLINQLEKPVIASVDQTCATPGNYCIFEADTNNLFFKIKLRLKGPWKRKGKPLRKEYEIEVMRRSVQL